jgi:hypothetical protein
MLAAAFLFVTVCWRYVRATVLAEQRTPASKPYRGNEAVVKLRSRAHEARLNRWTNQSRMKQVGSCVGRQARAGAGVTVTEPNRTHVPHICLPSILSSSCSPAQELCMHSCSCSMAKRSYSSILRGRRVKISSSPAHVFFPSNHTRSCAPISAEQRPESFSISTRRRCEKGDRGFRCPLFFVQY